MNKRKKINKIKCYYNIFFFNHLLRNKNIPSIIFVLMHLTILGLKIRINSFPRKMTGANDFLTEMTRMNGFQ